MSAYHIRFIFACHATWPFQPAGFICVFVHEISLPVGWVWNVIRANLPTEIFPHHMMNATLDLHGLLMKMCCLQRLFMTLSNELQHFVRQSP